MRGYVDDYPCPDPAWHPASGQSLEEFLTLDAKAIVDNMVPSELYIDDKPVVDKTMLPKFRLSTRLFNFTGDLSLLAVDGCVTGKKQQAVSDGWFAIIDGLKPGIHKFEFNNSKTGEIGNILKVTIGNNKVNDD
jgi:hypothetical protein